MNTKILIIEHDSNDMELIQDELKKANVSFITEIVETKEDYTDALHSFKPDIILSNYTFPSFDGLTALKIREKLVPQTPFIFVSESIDHENTKGLLKCGATDFVLKKRLFTLIDKVNLALQEAELTKMNSLLQQSEEKRIEELVQNEAKYRSLVESNMDAILLTVKEGQILSANAAACEIFQMTQEELCNSGRTDIVDITDSRLQILLEEREHAGRAKGELTFVRKDGSKFPGEITYVVFTDSSGQEKTSMTIRDITQRKQAEQALKASESFNKGVLDSLTSHIAVINSKGTILKVNKSWNSFAHNNGGKSSEKYSEGANYFDACTIQNDSTDEPASQALNGIKDVLSGVINEFYLEYPFPSPETDRWFSMRVNIFESTETMVLIEHHDISERKMAEQKLSITTHALQQTLNDRNNILNSSLDVICSVDQEGRFVSVSDAAETVWGYKPDELKGLKFMDLVFHEDAKRTSEEYIKIRNGLPVTMFENRYIHKNGSIVPMLWSSRWDESKQLGYAVARDATEKKNLEKAFEIERERFIDLYLQAPSCMGILKGPNHVYEMANPLYLQLIEKTDIIGKTVKEVLPELEAQGIFEFLDTVYKTGKTFSANEMLVKFDFHGNGKLVDTYLNFIYQAHRDSEGSIDGILFFAIDVTEQVVSRKKLEKSVLRYSSLIEQASDAICFMDASLKIIDVNHYACDKLGYSRAEIFQLSVADFFVAADLQANPLNMAVLKEGKRIRTERRIKRKDGTSIEMELSLKTLKDGGLIIFARDIRDRKKAQQELNESEKKYRFLFENNPMPMWIIDENTFKFLDVNEMAVLRYGYSRDEFLSMSAVDIRPEEDKERFIHLNNSSEINKTDQNKGTWKHLKKDGTIIPVEIIAQKIIYEGLKAQFILSNDITERKKAELNLEVRNKEIRDYKFVMDESSIVGITDQKGIIISANDNFCKISQFSREELIGQDHRILSSGYHPKEYIQNLWETLASGKTWKGELKNKAKDGTFYWVDTTIIPFLDERGKPYQYFATRYDITERKKADLNIEKQNKELIKTNSELDRFVYSVSHDLRSPLTSILGLLSFIEEETEESDTLEHSKMIRNSINRLDEFITNILNYSRNNRTGLEVKMIPLQKIAVAIVNSLHSMKQAKGIHFEIDIQEPQPFYSDSLRFNTILENLISNAIKYHKENQQDNFIKIIGRSDRDKLELTISDNGIGIAKAYHSKIFDMFFRLSGKTEGSGIGLYIVNETVERLEGSIHVESSLGAGTTFTIILKNLKT